MLDSFAFESYGLLGLFLLCFLSATILPLSSEALFLIFLKTSNFSPISILSVASLGNCLGGLTNYLLGFYGNKLFKKENKIQNKAIILAQKYGFYGAFFSWVPFIGDPLLVALGYIKSSFWKTIFFMSLGKCARYGFLILV